MRPPRLGGNERMGVFATRSPFRPNPLGLSCVELVKTEKTADEGTVLIVSGADIMSGTPIYDIKPYLPYTDIREGASGGFADTVKDYSLEVVLDEKFRSVFDGRKTDALIEVLSQDPRPGYADDPERIYGFAYAGKEIKFKVKDNILTVTAIEDTKND